MRVCLKCKQGLDISEFYKNKAYHDGRSTRCKECLKKAAQKRRDKNPGLSTKAHAKWRENNLAKHNAQGAKYRASRKTGQPNWLTKEQLEEIQQFYIEAKRLTEETGIQHHVDHICPLQGTDTCGLHVPWNLQILTATENICKSNKLL